jgi:hypothetical protein
MRRACAPLLVLFLLPIPLIAQDARLLLRNALKAIGAENLRTVQYSGSTSSSTYTRSIDFDAPVSEKPWTQQFDIWITPYGFLKRGMAATDITVNRQKINGKRYNVVTFTVEDRYPLNESRENPCGDFWDVTYLVVTRGKLKGYINGQNMIEKVQTWINEPGGDVRIETDYSAYEDFDGLKFPTRIVQKRGGVAVLDLTITGVKYDK